MTTSYLLFNLAGRLFGVKLSAAKEIFPWRKPRPVPLSYSYVEGLIDYRGTVYPVFNLGQRLGMKRPGPIGFSAGGQETAASPLKEKSIILFEERNVPFGVVVDSVFKMAVLSEPSEVPKKMEGIDPKYVMGLVNMDNQDVILLDFERMIHAG